MFGPDFLERAIIGLPIILFSLTIHEFSHGYIAYRFGDNTAKDMGRLTFNPLAHLDLFGTLVMIASGFRFGWAKPVPVNLYNVKNPRKADFWVSAAGPLSNMSLALVFGLIFQVCWSSGMGPEDMLIKILYAGVQINVALAFFNLIPLFPLDGSHILKSVLPAEFEYKLAQFDQFAPLVLILLVMVGGIWIIIGPFVRFFSSLFMGL